MDEAKAAYIISRCEGKAAKHLRPALRIGIYDKDPEGFMVFLQDLFNDPHLKRKAQAAFKCLQMQCNKPYKEFYLRFSKLATEAEIL